MAVKKTKKGGVKKSAGKGASFDMIMEEVTDRVGEYMRVFMHIADIYANLTPQERTRLIGAGIRNYGFIEKTRDVGKDNPAFLPPHFDMTEFSDSLHDFDIIRQLYLIIEKFETLISDSMLIRSNDLYRDALRVYNGLKEQAKGRVPGARDLFDALEPFFKRRRVSESEPTQKEELRKLKSIVKGKTEGEILVRNIKPKTTGGVREVIEENS
jgi:site-specific DNA-cytosine methylase